MKRNMCLYFVLIFAGFFTLCSCSEVNKGFTLDDCPVVAKHEVVGADTLTVCDFSLIGKDTIEIPVSSLFSDFQVLRLENQDEALTDASWKAWVSDNYVGVYSYLLSNFKLYNREGKFLNTTAALIGDGPEALYWLVVDSHIDEKNERIYILGQLTRKLLVFDLNGKPQKHIPLAYESGTGRFIIDTEQETLLMMDAHLYDTPSIIWEQDFNGNIIREIPSSRLLKEGEDREYGLIISDDRGNTANAIDFCINHSFRRPDTLYHYVENNRLKPVFTVNFKADKKDKHEYIELPDYYLVRVGITITWTDRPRVPNVLIDKKTLRGSYVRFKYDMLGNIDGQKWPIFDQGYCVSNLYSHELKEQLEEALAKPELLTPEMKEKLTELNNSITDDDNSILLIGKLK